MDALKPLADVIAVGADTASSIKQTQSASKASFPLLRDPDLKVSKLYDMQLRSEWPMAMMRAFPEMWYVIVDEKGIIRTQRVDLTFGDHANEMIILLKSP